MSQYVDALNALKGMDEHEPKMIGDQWRTPEWLFQAINKLYGPIVLDLFTDGQNAKCQRFFTAEDNALRQDWANVWRKFRWRTSAFPASMTHTGFRVGPTLTRRTVRSAPGKNT